MPIRRQRGMRNEDLDIDRLMYDDPEDGMETIDNYEDPDSNYLDLTDEDFQPADEITEGSDTPSKPMADDKLKLECLKIAINVAKLANRKDVINVADELFKFCRSSNSL